MHLLYPYSQGNWLYLAPSGIRGDAVGEVRGQLWRNHNQFGKIRGLEPI